MELTHKRYLKITFPFMLSSVAVPVIGAVDTAVVGRLGSPDYISAVALGAVIFSTIYWLLGFLRITTAGMTAQAVGREDKEEVFLILLRALLLAALIGLLLFAFHRFIFAAAQLVFQPEAVVALLMKRYFDILVWGFVPFLLYQVLAGWITGILQIKTVVVLELGTSLVNFILDLCFVNLWNLNIDGVAYASLLAQLVGFIVAVCYILCRQKCYLAIARWNSFFDKGACLKLTGCCTHLMIRTICMLFMINTFMRQSAAFGSNILAANSILFQIQYIIGDIFAGLSQSATLYAGVAVGEKNSRLFFDNLKINGLWSLLMGGLLSFGYYLLREPILYCFTDLPDVLAAAYEYDIYIVFFPFIAALGIVYYGIFNGALITAPICYSMLLTVIAFLISKTALIPIFGNAGLWQSFLIFYLGRTIFLLIFLPFLYRKLGFKRSGKIF